MARKKIDNNDESNVVVKTTKKKMAEKSVKKKIELPELKTLTVSQSELGFLLGITTPNITQMVQCHLLTLDDDGRLNLAEAVSAYCKRLRERTTADSRPSKNSVDTEIAVWKLQNLKTKNRDWRLQRDRECALEIVRTLSNAVLKLKEQAKMNPALVETFDQLLIEIGKVNIESIALAVEGETEEEEE